MNKIEKYANLAIKTGVNIKPGDYLMINASVENYDFARLLTKYAYEAGAKKVIVRFKDDELNRLHYLNQSNEALEEVPHYMVEELEWFKDKKAARIALYSPIPDVFSDVDSNKVLISNRANQKHLGFYSDFMMGSNIKWLVISVPNVKWAKKVFPNLSDKEAYDKLFDAILETSRVTDDNDPIKEWNNHKNDLKNKCNKLNNYNFKKLRYKNSLGTDFFIELVDNHIWCGGEEFTKDNEAYEPNIPTEEVYTMPHKNGCNGVVYSTKPLEYDGKLIENFKLEFKDGKVINYSAEKNEDALKALLEFDEGSSYLGEVALVSYDSPISNSGILFYNTLFDENASCHLALGQAYPMTIKNGINMSLDELKEKGYNDSKVHEDFMIGSKDLEIIGITNDEKEIKIFENGSFII